MVDIKSSPAEIRSEQVESKHQDVQTNKIRVARNLKGRKATKSQTDKVGPDESVWMVFVRVHLGICSTHSGLPSQKWL